MSITNKFHNYLNKYKIISSSNTCNTAVVNECIQNIIKDHTYNKFNAIEIYASYKHILNNTKTSIKFLRIFIKLIESYKTLIHGFCMLLHNDTTSNIIDTIINNIISSVDMNIIQNSLDQLVTTMYNNYKKNQDEMDTLIASVFNNHISQIEMLLQSPKIIMKLDTIIIKSIDITTTFDKILNKSEHLITKCKPHLQNTFNLLYEIIILIRENMLIKLNQLHTYSALFTNASIRDIYLKYIDNLIDIHKCGNSVVNKYKVLIQKV